MKKLAILFFAVVALSACSSGETKCEGKECDSTAVVAVDTAAAVVAVDTNTVVAVDTTSSKK